MERALPVEAAPAEILDAIAARPHLLEEGLTALARDVPLSDGATIPLLAIDSGGGLVLVTGPPERGSDPFPGIVDLLVALQGNLTVLKRFLGDRWPDGPEAPRLLALTQEEGAGPDSTLGRRLALLRGVCAEALPCRVVRVAGRAGLWIGGGGGRTGAPREKTASRSPGEDRVSRLLREARDRIAGLDREVACEEHGGELRFLFRGGELARLVREGNGLSLFDPTHAGPARILGRSDLEEALHRVIEGFFGRYGATEGTGSGVAESSSPPPPPGREFPSGGLAGMETAPLTREEIEEFLRPDGEGDS